MYKLLMIDDDQLVLQVTRDYFTHRGYTMQTASCAEDGFALLDVFKPECILLDIIMPQVDGFQVCRIIRKRSNVPILFLSGKADNMSIIKGLSLGADDYITKPYRMNELEARILANIRRSEILPINATHRQITLGPLIIDIEQHHAFIGKEELGLSNREFDLLSLLAKNRGKTVTYEQIAKHVWGSYRREDKSYIMIIVSRLRKKIDFQSLAGIALETIRGEGYCLM